MRFSVMATALCLVLGCERQVGQVELFGIRERDQQLQRPYEKTAFMPEMKSSDAWGKRIRSEDSVVTIAVHGANIETLPLTGTSIATGSHDVIVFAEVQENAAAGYGAPALTSVIFVGKDQTIPGRLNFQRNLAYGPTYFKGHPLKIKFSIMLLQKRKSQQQQAIVDLVGGLVGAAQPQYSALVSEAVGAIRGILRAMPDVVAFDFEYTLLSDNPAAHRAPVIGRIEATSREVGSTELRRESQGWDAATDWLRYGVYALVETKPYLHIRPNPQTQEPMFFYGGRLYTDASGQGRQVDANYLVFEILPGQLAQDDTVLLNASKLNESLLTTLRRSSKDIGDALRDIENHSKKLVSEYLRIEMEREAKRIEANEKNKLRRQKLFTQWTKLLIPTLPTTEHQQAALLIKELIEYRWEVKAAKPGEVPELPSAAADAAVRVSDFVLSTFQSQWQIERHNVFVHYRTLGVRVLAVTVRDAVLPSPDAAAQAEAELVDAVSNYVKENEEQLAIPHAGLRIDVEVTRH